jgi:hypothetical protein
MTDRGRWQSGWRGAVLLVAGVFIGATLITPAVAHVGGTLNHLWGAPNHIRDKVRAFGDPRWVNANEAAGGDLSGIYADLQIAANAVGGAEVANDALTDADINEASLGQVPNAATLNGLGPSAFMRSAVYTSESAVGAGTDLGDGTFFIDHSCSAGDILLSGGPANVSGTSDLVESFPFGTASWRARIHKNGLTDNFNVVVLCANQ